MKKEEFYRDAVPGSVGPLEGLKVLEATTSVAGPVVGTVLADLGAEVIKCDQPKVGDLCRKVPPFVTGSSSPLDSSAYYLSINRNKKNLTLDLKFPEGRDIFLDIARRMDVVVENYKPGTMEKWGVGYEAVKSVKPDIVYTSVSGFGQFGPYHTRPGYDPVGQAMGGLMSITGYPDSPPTRTGNAMADNITGWMGALGTLAALRYRDRTGKGQHVDACLVDTILYTSEFGITATAHSDFRWTRTGSRMPVVAPMNVFQCKDDYIFVLAALDSHWGKLCKLMGREDLITDPRTATIPARSQSWELIEEVFSQWVREYTVDEVLAMFDQEGLVASKILNFEQILQDGHIREREMVTEADHPLIGKMKLYGVGPKFSLTPARVRSAAPLLGQHNEEILHGWLGISPEKINTLKEKGVI